MTDTRTPREDLLRSQSAAATRVFMTLLTLGPASRVDIARLTGLSAAAVTKAVTPLLAVDLVREHSESPSTGHPGRPATLIAVVPDSLVTFGIKVNPDEIIAVATDLTTQVLATSHLPLARHDVASTADAIITACTNLSTRLGERARRLASIGVAVSGDVDSVTGEVRTSALMGWMGAPLGTLLADRLPVPVVVENDV
ncbi:MAG: ROK family protein, partial [Propionibacteriaceae bacterium]|nr:ROK family protein [Propionibacteriaceae bacterium]